LASLKQGVVFSVHPKTPPGCTNQSEIAQYNLNTKMKFPQKHDEHAEDFPVNNMLLLKRKLQMFM
jgi:hypothetical protein